MMDQAHKYATPHQNFKQDHSKYLEFLKQTQLCTVYSLQLKPEPLPTNSNSVGQQLIDALLSRPHRACFIVENYCILKHYVLYFDSILLGTNENVLREKSSQLTSSQSVGVQVVHLWATYNPSVGQYPVCWLLIHRHFLPLTVIIQLSIEYGRNRLIMF